MTEGTAAAVAALKEDRRLARSAIAVNPGGLAGAIAFLAENESPQLLVVEVAETGDALFQALAGLAEVCGPDAKVVLLGQENDIFLYKRLMEMGLSEYYCGPVVIDRLIAIIEGIFSDAASIQGRVIAFIGARGGVGSSTVATNTAYALSQQFKDQVILIDLDFPFGSQAMALNLQQRQNITEALAQPSRLDDVLLERFMLKVDDHLSVLPAPATLEGDFKFTLDSFEILMKIVGKMASFAVLDLPHSWSAGVPEVLLDANEVVVTACPDLLNLRDAKNIFDILTPKRGVNAPTRLVFNRVGASRKTELTAKDFEESLKVQPVASIPFDPALFGTALNNGEMVAQVNKASKAVKEFNKLASLVSARAPVTKAKAKGKAKGPSIFSVFKWAK